MRSHAQAGWMTRGKAPFPPSRRSSCVSRCFVLLTSFSWNKMLIKQSAQHLGSSFFLNVFFVCFICSDVFAGTHVLDY